MKKYYILFIIYFFLTNSNAQNTHHSGKIGDEQLKFFKENFNWNSEKILILNFLQPKYNCHYDTYKNLTTSTLWWKKFYKNIDLTNIANRYVYPEIKEAKEIINFKTHFIDKDEFILKHFFLNEAYCYGVLLVNQKGEYEQKSSEYSEKEIIEYITRLSN